MEQISYHTFEEEIEFVFRINYLPVKVNIGIYPEIKAPWFHHHQKGKDTPRKTLKC